MCYNLLTPSQHSEKYRLMKEMVKLQKDLEERWYVYEVLDDTKANRASTKKRIKEIEKEIRKLSHKIAQANTFFTGSLGGTVFPKSLDEGGRG